MDTLKAGMKAELEWEVTEALTTKRGDYRVFSTPSMTSSVRLNIKQVQLVGDI